MPDIVEHKRFVFTNAGINSNKVWQVTLYSNDDVKVEYGRIGKALQSKVHTGAGRNKMYSLIKEKTKPSEHYNGGCYKEIEVLDAAKNSSVLHIASKENLKKIASSEIATCPITRKLINFFTDVNAHNIQHATGGKITYDVSAGTFRTPVGIVTKSNIDKARDLLDDITDFISRANWGKEFIATLENYLMLIPQDVGRKFDPKSFCGDVASIQKQSQILDGLEASVQSILSAPVNHSENKSKDSDRLFNVKLSVLEDTQEQKRIIKYFEEGRKNIHVSSKMKLERTYTVDISTMSQAFESDGAKLENIHELWHGTKPSNILSILKGGFVIPPSTASHVCGRMFGNGVYFANSSTKSLNYATSYWGGRDEGRYFMFLCKVALGKYQVPSGSRSKNPDKGYDSYWAKKGQSGVVNDEIIVFRTSQIKPLYLTEWR